MNTFNIIKGTYAFIDYSEDFTVKIGSDEYIAQAQTGHFCVGGDYGKPSNCIAVYPCANTVLETLHGRGDEITLEDLECFNDEFETSYTLEQLNKAYTDIVAVLAKHQSIVNELEADAMNIYEADETVYTFNSEDLNVYPLDAGTELDEEVYIVIDKAEAYSLNSTLTFEV